MGLCCGSNQKENYGLGNQAENPEKKPDQKLVRMSAEQPAENPAKKPTKKPVGMSVEQQAKKLDERLAEMPAKQLDDMPAE